MYLLIENFNAGMDSRRMALTAKPGTLQEAINCHVTRGGEIEKRKAFVPITTFPKSGSTPLTFGLHAANGQLWTFGSTASPTITQPPGPGTSDPLNDVIPRLNYMRLLPPAAVTTFVLPETLIPRVCTTAPQKNLTCTKTSHGLVDNTTYSISIAGVSSNRQVKVTNANVFVISTAETGTVIIPSGTCTSAVSSVGTGITVTVAADTTVSDAGIDLGTTEAFYFPENHAADGSYKVHNYPGDLSFQFDVPTSTTTFTKVLFPQITKLKSGVTDPWSGAGGTNLVVFTNPVKWVFDSTFTSSGSRDLTAKALAARINEGTGTHGFTAAAGSAGTGVISLIATSGPPGDDIFIAVRCSKVLSNSGVVDRGVIAELKAGATNMTKLICAENYGGNIYVIAEFDNTSIFHFFNGQAINDWQTIALSGDNASVATYFASRIRSDGYYSSISSGADIYINFTEVNVSWTVTASTINGGAVGDQTLTVTTTAATSTTAQVTKVSIGGTYEPQDLLTVNISGVDYTISAGSAAIGRYVRTHQYKMYSTAGSLLFFSETDTNGGAGSFSLDTLQGSGFINMTNQDSGSESLTSLEVYQGKLAIFSKTAVQVWTMNADPRQNSIGQIINNVGTYAPKSVKSLGNIDTFFLSASGIRSLKARDASNSAVVADVGTPIDSTILSDMRALTQTAREAAVGLIEPAEGRYWLSVGTRIYVYSYFPTPNIMAWSVYEPTDMTKSPGSQAFSPEDMVSLNQRVYIRANDTLYAYGSYNGNTYDTSAASITFPFMDAGKPAHTKTLHGLDCACEGTWGVYIGMDATQPTDRPYQGALVNSSYSLAKFPATGVGTHIGVKMTNSTAEYARIGNFAAHFEINDAS
jgi:hypothetical protein